MQQCRNRSRRAHLGPHSSFGTAVLQRVDAQYHCSTRGGVDRHPPDRDADLVGEVGEVVKDCQFWLDDLGPRTRFKPDLEFGVGEVAEEFRVPGIEGEGRGGRSDADLKGLVGEAVVGLNLQDSDHLRAVFEGSWWRYDALEGAVPSL